MASLHVRNLDESLIARLKQRAVRHGRSAEAEHREILKAALDWERPDTSIGRSDWWERADAFRKSLEGRPQTPSEVLLRESRDER